MKRNHKHTMQLAAGACLALALSGPALADDTAAPDTSAWVCKFCVVPAGWFGELDFGLIYLDDWSPKFGDYRGFDDDGLFIGAGGDVAYRGEAGYYLDLAARDLGLDSRQLDVRGGKQGGYELQLSYSEIQRYMGYGTVTPYSGVGSDRLTLAGEDAAHRHGIARMRRRRDRHVGVGDRYAMRGIKTAPSGTRQIDLGPPVQVSSRLGRIPLLAAADKTRWNTDRPTRHHEDESRVPAGAPCRLQRPTN